jgi:hypothetical protein
MTRLFEDIFRKMKALIKVMRLFEEILNGIEAFLK